MEYEAQFGKVKTGDYVVVVTNDYMHRRTTTTVGMVQDDGYVYCGNQGISKRKIGSDGCPVCKLDAKLVPEGIAQSIRNFIQSETNKQVCPNRYFIARTTNVRTEDGKVVNKEQLVEKVVKKNLPADVPFDEAKHEVFKNICRRHGGYNVNWHETYRDYDYTVVEISSTFDCEEVTYAEYAKTKQELIKLPLD